MKKASADRSQAMQALLETLQERKQSLSAMAEDVGLRRQSVSAWYDVPIEWVPEVSMFSMVSPADLRPDLAECVRVEWRAYHAEEPTQEQVNVALLIAARIKVLESPKRAGASHDVVDRRAKEPASAAA